MPGGKFDSSLTRVVPVFERLKARGGDWVRALLHSATGGHPDAKIENSLDLSFQRGFWGNKEQGLRPPAALLTWLVTNPHRLRERVSANADRQKLLACEPEAIAKACRLLAEQPASRAWYVFERYTYPDAVIYTPDAIVVVEGKRTEAGPTVNTSWLAGRHQIWRHIDAAWEIREKRHVYGLFLVESVAGGVPTVWRDAAANTVRDDVLASSLPHRTQGEADEVSRCFLGACDWQSLCTQAGLDAASLPRTTDDIHS